MSAFRDILARDIRQTFLNTDEFADRMEITWRHTRRTIPAVLTGAATAAPLGISDTDDGLYLSEALLHVSREDLGGQPERGELIYLDGVAWLIDRSSLELGMIELGLRKVTE